MKCTLRNLDLRVTCVAALIVIGLASAGCHRATRSVALWIGADPPYRTSGVRDEWAVGEGPGPAARIELAGAINEALSFRFAVRARGGPVDEPDFRIAPFSSTGAQIDPSVVTLYRVRRVTIGNLPGWHLRSVPPDRRDARPLDVLVPLHAPRGALPGSMTPGETYHFWADVTIPKATFAGTYATRITLCSRGRPVGAITVQLTVWPFILPDQADLPVIAELDHRALFRHHVAFRGRPHAPSVDDWRGDPRRDELDASLCTTLRMLQSHRLTPVLHRLTPSVKIGPTGAMTIDWTAYDAVVAPCLSGRAFFNRVALPLWPLPIGELFSSPGVGAAPASLQNTALLEEYLTRCARHFDENGWLDRSYILPPGVSGPAIESFEAVRRFAACAARADPRIRVVSRGFPQDMKPLGWVGYPCVDFADSVDIWMPPAQFYDADTMAAQRAAGKQTWIAVDRPPFSGTVGVAAASTHVRVLTWQARMLGASALFVGCVNRWPDARGNPTPDACIEADPNVLLYPGRTFGLADPVPSVRLKWLRRSLQDAAYGKLLSHHGLEHVVTTLQRSLAPYAGSDAYRTHFADGRPIGWVTEPAVFEAARHIMAEAFIGKSSPGVEKSRSERFTRNATWRRFMLEARKVRVFVDGTRVRMAGTRTTLAATVECALTIVNGKRAPVSGTAGFLELPEGWSAASGPQRVGPIAPNGTRRVTLIAYATAIPIRVGGFFMLPLEFLDDEGKAYRVDARVCYVAAEPTTRPIEIDGDLSDWPPGSTNVAADFILITGAPPRIRRAAGRPAEAPVPPSTSRPHNRTTAFFMRDEGHLYLAINCETDAGVIAAAPRRKTVVYDDLIPVGEELIEVLIDPFNTGTRSPSDLYHIVVKRAGGDLTEKGVRFDPPCGTHEPWAVDIELATRISWGRWTAEVAIPLAALGPRRYDHATWGLSITRYDAARQEFSTWSGATRNAYDPLSLGNLYLP